MSTLLESGNGGGPDGTFRGGGVFEVVGRFELDEQREFWTFWGGGGGGKWDE